MRGRNLSFLAVGIILIVASMFIAFTVNQGVAKSPPEICKISGEKWDYYANNNLPPFDCCPGLSACPDGYCCEMENEVLPVTAHIVTHPAVNSNPPPAAPFQPDQVIAENSETSSPENQPQSQPEQPVPETQANENQIPEPPEPKIISIRKVYDDEPADSYEPAEPFEPEIACYKNSECGSSGWIGSPYCKNENVWQTWRTYTCKSPGTVYSYCTKSDTETKKQDCDKGCDSGYCSHTVSILSYACYNNSDCGTDDWLGQEYCTGGGGENEDVADTYRTYTCHNGGTPSAYCTHKDEDKIKQDCGDTSYGNWVDPFCYDGDVWRYRPVTYRGCDAYGCYQGSTTEEEKLVECGTYTCTDGQCDFECYEDADCGTNGWTGSAYCKSGDVYQEYRTYTCSNAGTINSACSHTDQEQKKEECGTKDCINGQCVTPANNPPSIDSYSPTSNPTITIGQSQAFSITKSDADGDPLTVKWYVDNQLKQQNTDSYTFTPSSARTYSVNVTVSDGKDSVSHLWTLTVNPQGNEPPSIDSYSPTASNPRINLGETKVFSITKSDPDLDPLTVKWYVDNQLKQQNTDSYSYTGLIPGNFEVMVTVSDGEYTVSHTWTLTVNKPSNRPPQINSYSPTTNPTINMGQRQDFSITSSDPDGDPLTVKWYVDNQLQQEGPSNEFTYKPMSAGTYKVKVEVTDGWDTVSRTWTLTVNAVGDLPDLRITGLRVMWPPDKILAGETVTFEFIVKNVGKEKAENVKFKLNTGNSVWSSPYSITLDVDEDIYVFNEYVYSSAGTYTVTATADPGNIITESNENNNDMSIDITVTAE